LRGKEASMKVLKLGMVGSDVRFCQARLERHGYRVAIDGQFGPKTHDAVELFQESHGLTVDGIVGARTWQALMVEEVANEPVSMVAQWKREMMAYLDSLANIVSYERLFVLRAACESYGRREMPAGSNGGPDIAHIVDPGGAGSPPSAYQKHWKWSDVSKMPEWCCIFVAWAVRLGLSSARGEDLGWQDVPFGDWFGSVNSQLVPWAQEHDRVSTTPEPGMAFVMKHHTGFVLKVNDDGTFDSIEGNWASKVTSVNRKVADMRMFVRVVD
jgi:hypothetical protein